MSYETIRKSLQYFLHQDFDLDSETLADAILKAVKHADYAKLVSELEQLRSENDTVIEEVLNDHDVHLWDSISPHDLLVTLRTLANLL
jgi:hypothetical protein